MILSGGLLLIAVAAFLVAFGLLLDYIDGKLPELKEYQALPVSWFGGARFPRGHVLWLRLPSYDWAYRPHTDAYGWVQWTILWSFRHGWKLHQMDCA